MTEQRLDAPKDERLELWDWIRTKDPQWLPVVGHIFAFAFSPEQRETLLSALRPALPSERNAPGTVAVPIDMLDNLLRYGYLDPVQGVIYGEFSHAALMDKISALKNAAPQTSGVNDAPSAALSSTRNQPAAAAPFPQQEKTHCVYSESATPKETDSDGWIWSLDPPEVSAWRWIETWNERALSFSVQRFHVGETLAPSVACWRYINPPSRKRTERGDRK